MFSNDLDRYFSKLNKEVKAKIGKCVKQAYTVCITQAPVDTGTLRYNFKVGNVIDLDFT
jgi:hypothetical protein